MWQPLRVPGFAALLSTQFLGTLNDNLLKMVVTLLAAGMAVQGGGSAYLVALSVLLWLRREFAAAVPAFLGWRKGQR